MQLLQSGNFPLDLEGSTHGTFVRSQVQVTREAEVSPLGVLVGKIVGYLVENIEGNIVLKVLSDSRPMTFKSQINFESSMKSRVDFTLNTRLRIDKGYSQRVVLIDRPSLPRNGKGLWQ